MCVSLDFCIINDCNPMQTSRVACMITLHTQNVSVSDQILPVRGDQRYLLAPCHCPPCTLPLSSVVAYYRPIDLIEHSRTRTSALIRTATSAIQAKLCPQVRTLFHKHDDDAVPDVVSLGCCACAFMCHCECSIPTTTRHEQRWYQQQHSWE